MAWGIVHGYKGACTGPCYMGAEPEKLAEAQASKVEPIINFLGSKKFLCGDAHPSYVDFELFELCQLNQKSSEGKFFELYPRLAEYCEVIGNLNGVKELFNSDATQNLAFNNKNAKYGASV